MKFFRRNRVPTGTHIHIPSLCERHGHKYRLTTGVWTCGQCGDAVDRDCRAGCIFAADGINCEDVARCEFQPRRL